MFEMKFIRYRENVIVTEDAFNYISGNDIFMFYVFFNIFSMLANH